MSSIIKALKKIEEQSNPLEDEQPRPLKIKGQRPARRQGQRSSNLTRWIAVTAGICLILACLVFLITQRKLSVAKIIPTTSSASQETQQTKQTKAPPHQVYHSKISISRPQADRTSGTERLVPQKKPDKIDEPPPPYSRRSAANRHSAINHQATPQAQTIEESQPKPTSTKQQASVPSQPARQTVSKTPTTQVINPGNDRQAVPSTNSDQAAETFADASLLQDSAIQLQAIAWSEVPLERMAVINGRIMREGHAIDGFTIERIRADDIILNDGSQLWRLDFR